MDTETLNKDNHNSKSNLIAISAILLACIIGSGLLPTVNTPIVRIGFGFIPILVASMMLPKTITVLLAVLGDIIKYFLFYSSFGPLNIGITFGAGVSAFIFSIFLGTLQKKDWRYNKEFVIRVVVSSLLAIVIADLGINTFALSIMNGKAWLAILIPRIYSESVMLILHILAILIIAKFISVYKENKSN